jgi:hypothetical protein
LKLPVARLVGEGFDDSTEIAELRGTLTILLSL